ncbi:MAG: DUF2478 domain-containing protein [Geminicoccaceae bacterium]
MKDTLATTAGRQSAKRLGTVRFEDGEPVDALLDAVVRLLKADGHHIAGYVQRETNDGDGCCSLIHLENIADGRTSCITQPLGPGSRGCRLDPRVLADLCSSLLAEIDVGADILLLNRFGKAESEGQGFRTVIEKAFDKGIPTLIGVRNSYVDAWNAFGGTFADDLPADAETLIAWCRLAIGEKR